MPTVQTQTDGISLQTFPLYAYLQRNDPYVTSENEGYAGNVSDFVTNSMLATSPNYLLSRGYTQINLNATSYFIPGDAYRSLMRSDLSSIAIVNNTHWTNSGHGVYYITAGVKDGYNNSQYPIHLVWRTRSDLSQIWPDASLPLPGNPQGITYDFMTWALNWGHGDSYMPHVAEYPEWEMFQSGRYIDDQNIRRVWDMRSDLQIIYTDAHYYHSGSGPATMMEWAKQYGFIECPAFLTNYDNWPYIGSPSSRAVTITGPTQISHSGTYQWTCAQPPGSDSYIYTWYKISAGNTITLLGEGQTRSLSISSLSGFTLKVSVKKGSNSLVYSGSIAINGVQLPRGSEEDKRPDEEVSQYVLEGNYPNPFNPSTQMRFGLPEAAHVSLVLYDILGREVATLANGMMEAGYHSAIWNAQNAASGMYFARLVVIDALGKQGYAKTTKLMLMK